MKETIHKNWERLVFISKLWTKTNKQRFELSYRVFAHNHSLKNKKLPSDHEEIIKSYK